MKRSLDYLNYDNDPYCDKNGNIVFPSSGETLRGVPIIPLKGKEKDLELEKILLENEYK